ncbi:HAD hydrolase family protein [Streptomyces sp. NPDC048584]|uniref:HAD hydrolase family protein n=1 Tax=Streptomyces sp. NPDC048584 TaxID=3365573 RepID=UPI003721D6A5
MWRDTGDDPVPTPFTGTRPSTEPGAVPAAAAAVSSPAAPGAASTGAEPGSGVVPAAVAESATTAVAHGSSAGREAAPGAASTGAEPGSGVVPAAVAESATTAVAHGSSAGRGAAPGAALAAAVAPVPASDGAPAAVADTRHTSRAASADSARLAGEPGAGASAEAAAGGRGVNHDKAFRPRRQDRPQDFLETGAAYAMDAAGFRTHRHRFFGRTELVRTDPARVLEIDDPHELARARALAPLFDAERPGALPTAADIDAVVLDFDGTQTDDRVLIDSDGREFVSVHRGDGLGIAALRRSGLELLILSTEQNPVVAARARKLKLPVLHGIDRKDLALKQWCEEQGIAPERVLYVGNDVNDLPCFALVGWPVAVASAHDVVRGAARAVTTLPGGDGAIREIAGWILGPSLDSLPS